MRVTISQWGNSLGVRFPIDYVRDAKLNPGDEIEFNPQPDNTVNLVPIPKKGNRQKLLKALAKIAKRKPSGPDIAHNFRHGDRY